MRSFATLPRSIAVIGEKRSPAGVRLYAASLRELFEDHVDFWVDYALARLIVVPTASSGCASQRLTDPLICGDVVFAVRAASALRRVGSRERESNEPPFV
jgi:hypothetical protein